MTAYGKGAYFARDASYSSHPTYSRPNAQGVQHMFLARVVIGEYCRGVQNALAPPVNLTRTLARPFTLTVTLTLPIALPLALTRRATARSFDSTVDDVRNPRIFVTYRDSQAYPDYLVKFRQ